MCPSLMDDDYVRLSQYFEEQGNKSKQNMLVIVPWIITLTAGLLGFAIKEGLFTNPDKNLEFVLWFGVGGIIGSFLAGFLIIQFGNHIQSSWARSQAVKDRMKYNIKNKIEGKLTKEDYLEILKATKYNLPMIGSVLLVIAIILFLASTMIIFRSQNIPFL